MKDKSKLILISITVLVMLLVSVAGFVFAYFSQTVEFDSPNLTLKVDDEAQDRCVVSVESVYDLKIWARDSKYNTKDNVSSQNARYILLLKNDITLDENIEIDRDISIILNGYNLNLGKFNLTVHHTYYARLLISNERYTTQTPSGIVGKITADKENGGKLFYNIPNGVVVIGAEIEDKNILVSADFNQDQILDLLKNYIEERVFDFYVGDIDIVENFKGYPFVVEWEFFDIYNQTEKISSIYYSNGGNLLQKPNAGSVEIFYEYKVYNRNDLSTILLSNTSVEDKKILTLLADDEISSRLDIGKNLISDYLKQYLKPATVNGDKLYELFLSIDLPLRNTYFGLEFSYSTQELNVESDGTLTEKPDTLNLDLEEIRDKNDKLLSVILKRPSTPKTLRLTATVTFASISGTENNSSTIEFVFKSIDGNNNNAAQTIINNMGALIVENENSILPLITQADKINANIKSVSYTFENNDNHYEIVNDYEYKKDDITAPYITDILKVVGDNIDNLPDIAKKIYLVIEIEFYSGNPLTIERTMQIFYVNNPQGGGGEAGTDAYATHHAQVVSSINEQTNSGQTYATFRVSRNPINDGVFVNFYIKGGNNEKVSVTNYNDYAEFVINFSALQSQNDSFDIYFRYAKIESPDNSEWDNVLYYGQKKDSVDFEDAAAMPIILDGIVKLGRDILDLTLYNKIYDYYNIDDLNSFRFEDIDAQDAILSYLANGHNFQRVITKDELNQIDKISLDLSYNIGESRILQFKGLELLENLSELKIYDSEFKNSDLQYLCQLTMLKELTVSNSYSLNIQGEKVATFTATKVVIANVLYDIANLKNLVYLDLSKNGLSQNLTDFDLNEISKLETLILQNANIKDFSAFEKLTINLQKLWLNNIPYINVSGNIEYEKDFENTIKNFNDLLKLLALNEVHFYGNNYYNENLVDSTVYGSEGKFNFSTYILLNNRKIASFYSCVKEIGEDGEEKIKLLIYQPSKNEKIYAQALQSVFYLNTVKIVSNKVSIDLVRTLQIGNSGNFYTIEYSKVYNDNNVIISNGANSVQLVDSAPSIGKKYEIAMTIVNADNVNTFRVIEIEVVV